MIEQFVIAAIKLYHKKEVEAFEDMFNFVCNNISFPERKGASVDRVWFWGLKRWGKYFADKEYDIRDK